MRSVKSKTSALLAAMVLAGFAASAQAGAWSSPGFGKFGGGAPKINFGFRPAAYKPLVIQHSVFKPVAFQAPRFQPHGFQKKPSGGLFRFFKLPGKHKKPGGHESPGACTAPP